MLGGIIARTACEISSQQLPERLPTNAVVKESGDLFCTCIGQTGRESIQPLPTLGWIPQPCRHNPFCSFVAPVLYLTPNLDMIDLHDKHLTSSHHFTFFGQKYSISCFRRCSSWVKDSTMSCCWVRVQATDTWLSLRNTDGDGERVERDAIAESKKITNSTTLSVTEDTNIKSVFAFLKISPG